MTKIQNSVNNNLDFSCVITFIFLSYRLEVNKKYWSALNFIFLFCATFAEIQFHVSNFCRAATTAAHSLWLSALFRVPLILQLISLPLLTLIIYRTRAIITRGLYTFYPLVKSKNVFSRGLCMVSIQERFLIKSGI